jgi:uncharacterized protein
MEFIVVACIALLGSLLSFMSGFGLGTILLPTFLLFFPLEIAVLATALVHMANNLFKLWLVGKYADKRMIIRFGITSVLGAYLGATLIDVIPNVVFHSYQLFGISMQLTSMKTLFGCIILFFAFYELRSENDKRTISDRWLPWGGAISGFFGGLSGHQGALRSAFLMRTELTKEAFMGTRVVLACLVDLTRISVYVSCMELATFSVNPMLIVIASLAAFVGAWFGKKWMQKSETPFINRFIAVSMILFALALIAGLI